MTHRARSLYSVAIIRPTMPFPSVTAFSKCHLERTTPADPFTRCVDDHLLEYGKVSGKQRTTTTIKFGDVARFARAWTRGYDVYYPVHTIVTRLDKDDTTTIHSTIHSMDVTYQNKQDDTIIAIDDLSGHRLLFAAAFLARRSSIGI